MASQRAHLKAIFGIGFQQCPSSRRSSLRKILPAGGDNGGGKDDGRGDVGGGDGGSDSSGGGWVGSGSIAGHGCNIHTQHSV